jgi:site-specific recombinase XerC
MAKMVDFPGIPGPDSSREYSGATDTGTDDHVIPDAVSSPASAPTPSALLPLRPPTLILAAGDDVLIRFAEFFTAHIRNKNTRRAYHRNAVTFLRWCEESGIADLKQIRPVVVAAYVEGLQATLSKPSVKQHLASIRVLMDWLVVGQVVPVNPASSVRGPKHVVKKGKTPILDAGETRQLLDSIDVAHVVGLRDRAILAAMVYSFARVGAMLAMRVEDYYTQGRRGWLRLHEKGGKEHEMPAHHNLETYVDAYIAAAGIAADAKEPLFRTARGKSRTLTARPMSQPDVFRMIRRRAQQAGLRTLIGCHSFRATGITNYLENGGTLEKAQAMANHESPRTTKLYDRTRDQITLDEVERIMI